MKEVKKLNPYEQMEAGSDFSNVWAVGDGDGWSPYPRIDLETATAGLAINVLDGQSLTWRLDGRMREVLGIKPTPIRAPIRSERILTLLVPADRQEEVLGDFEENLQFVAARHGERWATYWYGWQVTCYAIGRLTAFAGQVGGAIGKLWKPI